MISKSAFFAATTASMLATTVMAADLPRKSVAPAFVAAPVSSWTGFYVGVSAGAQLSDATWTTTSVPFFAGGIPIANSENRGFDKTSFRLGAYAGYNWQLNPNWVVGAEIDFGATLGGKKTSTGLPGLGLVANSSDRLSHQNNYDGSLRLRAGYLITPSILLYGTGGLALQQYDIKATCPGDATSWCIAARSQSDGKTRTGWTLGAGVEGMLTNNLLARVEYRYSDFGRTSHSLFPTAPVDTINGRMSLKSHTIQAGIAYKF